MRGKVAPRIAGWVLVALVVFDLWSIERLYWEFSAPAEDLYATDTTIEFLKKISQPFRVLAIGIPELPMARNDPNFDGDGLMVHGVRTCSATTATNSGDTISSSTGHDREPDLVGAAEHRVPAGQRRLDPDAGSAPRGRAGEGCRGHRRCRSSSFPASIRSPGSRPVMIKYPDAAVIDAFKATNFPVHSVAIFDTSSKVAGGADHRAAGATRHRRRTWTATRRPHRAHAERPGTQGFGAGRVGELLSRLARHGGRQAGDGRARGPHAHGRPASRGREEGRARLLERQL